MNEKMNSFMDDLKEKTVTIGAKAAEVAKSVGNKAGETAEVAAVNLKIKKAEGEIRGIYRRIGEAAYMNESREIGEREDITPLIGEVDAKNVEIEQLKKEIESIREKYAAKRESCGCCGEEPAAAGEEAETEVPVQEQEEERVCPVCGKNVQTDDVFCPACGTKL